MLIISKVKDYYDGVAANCGIDKTIVYNRETIELPKESHPKIFNPHKWKSSGIDGKINNLIYYSIKPNKKKIYTNYGIFIIGFCGKLYIGWSFCKEEIEYDCPNFIGETKKTYEISYDIDFVKSIIQDKSWNSSLVDDIKCIKTYNPIEIFRELNVPIFVYTIRINGERINRFFLNPILKKYEFYKISDTYLTFQEIQMFISGVLGSKEKEIIEVADKYKIEQYGFNKWSFRKESKKIKKLEK